eukprot:GEMP01050470.1.p1 GENE.GEMP01050470.1~~GEMP01050470.1.p1  ORF type:complete len:158 (+),score=32.97 GEMP01050470.1:346-819(+)
MFNFVYPCCKRWVSPPLKKEHELVDELMGEPDGAGGGEAALTEQREDAFNNELAAMHPNARLVTVDLTKTQLGDSVLGIDVDFGESNYLFVEGISSKGLVPNYNKQVLPDEQICVGDRIVCVNGINMSAGMVYQCRLASELKLQVLKADWLTENGRN